MSWRHLCKTSSTCFGHVFKTSLQDVWPRRTYSSWSRHFQDVFSRCTSKGNILILIKMSWRHLLKTKTKDVFKTSLLRQRFAGKSHELKSGDWAAHGLSVFFWEITLSTNLCVKSSSVAFAVWVWGVAPSCIKHCWLITISHPIERCI